jgi:hypothetical protein
LSIPIEEILLKTSLNLKASPRFPVLANIIVPIIDSNENIPYNIRDSTKRIKILYNPILFNICSGEFNDDNTSGFKPMATIPIITNNIEGMIEYITSIITIFIPSTKLSKNLKSGKFSLLWTVFFVILKRYPKIKIYNTTKSIKLINKEIIPKTGKVPGLGLLLPAPIASVGIKGIKERIPTIINFK